MARKLKLNEIIAMLLLSLVNGKKLQPAFPRKTHDKEPVPFSSTWAMETNMPRLYDGLGKKKQQLARLCDQQSLTTGPIEEACAEWSATLRK